MGRLEMLCPAEWDGSDELRRRTHHIGQCRAIALSQGLHITQFGQFWSGVGLFLVFHNVF